MIRKWFASAVLLSPCAIVFGIKSCFTDRCRAGDVILLLRMALPSVLIWLSLCYFEYHLSRRNRPNILRRARTGPAILFQPHWTSITEQLGRAGVLRSHTGHDKRPSLYGHDNTTSPILSLAISLFYSTNSFLLSFLKIGIYIRLFPPHGWYWRCFRSFLWTAVLFFLV